MGDLDLVYPLATCGVPTWVVAAPGRPPRFSNYVEGVIPMCDPWRDTDQLVERLLDFAARQPERPVLFYEDDGSLALVSRHRTRLRDGFRFLVPDADLVEALLDKAKFLDLAGKLGLPVPPTRLVDVRTLDVDLPYPLALKPLDRDQRDRTWPVIGGAAKAVRVADSSALQKAVALLPEGEQLLAQTLVVGPETAVESYHAYLEADGTVVGEFTGKKIRTWPPEFGFSTALMTSHAPDVAEMGREVLRRLGLAGVAKLDLKRAADGSLYLLEVNPRFTLWNHLGAKAGVNIPGLVYSHLAGEEREPSGPARAGVTWCDVPKDLRSVRTRGVPFGAWLRWMLECDIKADLMRRDPLPFLRGRLLSWARKSVRVRGGGQASATRNRTQATPKTRLATITSQSPDRTPDHVNRTALTRNSTHPI